MNNFSIDHCFYIGSTHNVCQDYAISGFVQQKQQSLYYGIISDGCSTARDSDIGSRIICKLAERFIKEEYKSEDNVEDIYFSLKNYLLKKLSELNLKLVIETYFATLLLFIATQDKTDIFVFGDGYLKIKEKDNEIIKGFKYSQNAPAYLAYDLSTDNKKSYLTDFKQLLEITNIEIKENLRPEILISKSNIINSEFREQNSILLNAEPQSVELLSTIIKKVDEPVFYRITNKNVLSISIMSDGIDSFTEILGGHLKDIDIVQELTNYKNTNGTFVTRRTKAFLRDCTKRQIQHKDDLSIASISFNQEKIYE